MHKKRLIALAVSAIVLVSVSLIVWSLLAFPQTQQKYEKSINRNFESREQEQALLTAENLNYSGIASVDRFDGPTDASEYLHPSTYLSYTYANFVDAETIHYYQTRYEDLQGKGYPRHIEFAYDANVSELHGFRVYNSPPPEGVAWYNTTLVMVSTTDNGSTVAKCSVMPIFIRNQTGYQLIDPCFDYNFTNCYVVETRFEYNEVYAPTAAFYAVVNQIVVLDRNYSPLLIGIAASGAVA